MTDADKKIILAKNIIENCKGKYGFQASLYTYAGEYWLRDLAYSLDTLLDMGYEEEVKFHLQNLLNGQKEDGSLPTVKIDFFSKEFLRSGLKRFNHHFHSLINFRSTLDFILSPQYHKGISDTGPLMLIAIDNFTKNTGDNSFQNFNSEKLRKLKKFLLNSLSPKLGLLLGLDWRDQLTVHRKNFLLTNQIILNKALETFDKSRAKKVKTSINTRFWNENLGYYLDSNMTLQFDSFAHSLGILWDIFPEDRITQIIKNFEMASTNIGIRNIWPPYSRNHFKMKENFYQNSTVWPFIEGHVILALEKAGENKFSKREFNKFSNLKGFYEWYNPLSGKPNGSKDQLWSAALYLHAFKMVK